MSPFRDTDRHVEGRIARSMQEDVKEGGDSHSSDGREENDHGVTKRDETRQRSDTKWWR